MDPNEKRRAAIQDSLKKKNQIRVELVQIRDNAVARTKEARHSYAQAVGEREAKARRFNVKLITAVAADPTVQEGLAKLSHKLGFTKKIERRPCRSPRTYRGLPTTWRRPVEAGPTITRAAVHPV